jgi:polyhydroxybutyrate depolymerase
MKKAIIALIVLIAAAGACRAEDWYSAVIHESKRREFKVHAPDSYDGKKFVPLVIVLHGGGGRNTQIERFTGFSRLADKEGFIAVYPQGIDGQWNDGRDIQQSRAHREKIGDTGFILKMITEIKNKYKINESRIYACGISNGGFMSMRLACELSDRLAAVAVVCAGMTPYLFRNCRPESQISVLLMNGTADPLVPYNGGYVTIFKRTRGQVLSTDDTIKFWRGYNGCHSEPLITGMNPDTSDDTEIMKYDYQCPDGIETVLYKVIGGGHTWPGAAQYLPEEIVGKVSRDINATEVIWGFFKRHKRAG